MDETRDHDYVTRKRWPRWSVRFLFFALPTIGICLGVLVDRAGRQIQERAVAEMHTLVAMQHFGFFYHLYYEANRSAPSNVEALESFTTEGHISIYPSNDESEAYRMVRDGQLVVIWNAVIVDDGEENDRYVLAYERDVPENGRLVLTGGGAVRKVTADQLNALPRFRIDERRPTPHAPQSSLRESP